MSTVVVKSSRTSPATGPWSSCTPVLTAPVRSVPRTTTDFGLGVPNQINNSSQNVNQLAVSTLFVDWVYDRQGGVVNPLMSPPIFDYFSV